MKIYRKLKLFAFKEGNWASGRLFTLFHFILFEISAR